MKNKILGRTGISVTCLGLGGAFLGITDPRQAAAQYRNNHARKVYMTRELGVQTVLAAVKAGCKLFDTAPWYGGGESEYIIGQAIRDEPGLFEDSVVTTKIGACWVNDGFDHSYDAAMRSVEASLLRLGLSQLKIVYLHDLMGFDPKFVMGPSGSLVALRQLQHQGVVEFLGVACNDPVTNAAYIETGEFDVAVVPQALSLVNLKAFERIIPAARRHDVGLIVATAVERGLLIRGCQPGADYLDTQFSEEIFEHVGRIQGLCHQWNVPLSAAAIQWCLRQPQVSSVLVGARVPAEIKESVTATNAGIPEDFWSALQSLIRHFDR